MKRFGHLPMSDLAYQDPGFHGEHCRQAAAHSGRVYRPDQPPAARGSGRHDRDVRFGAHPAARPRTRAAQEKCRAPPAAAAPREWRTKIAAAKSIVGMSRYYEEARELSRRITAWAMTLGAQPKRFVICSGGGPGIMEAANRGAAEAGGSSIGLSIQLPHEQRPNPYISPDLNFCFHYFFMRKLWFAQMAKALIVFPGGFGTMDELWEMLTLMQTGKLSSRHLILIYGRKYWNRVVNWRHMVRSGTVSEREFKMLQFTDTVDDAFDHVRGEMEKHHLALDVE